MITVTDASQASVSLAAFNLEVVNVVIPGDIDDNKEINLKDALLACKICSGISVDSTVYKEADINGDGKIGIAEILYILRILAALN